MWFFRFFFNGPLQKIVERFPPPKAILDTDEPSSDRLIQEGWPLLRRLSFFFGLEAPNAGSELRGFITRRSREPDSTRKWVLPEKAQT
jgi:hypothetical protein